MLYVRVIGPGRAGRAIAAALSSSGARVAGLLGRGDDLRGAAAGVDALVLATPDDAVASVAATVVPAERAVVMHLSGSLGLDVLAPHPRRASLHPLVPMPDAETGCRRLLAGAAWAVDGDALAAELVRLLGGRARRVAPDDRAAYHAAACMAANHVVALLGQVERVAATAGLALDDFLDLARASLDDVARLGPVAALTGPAARGDDATVARHRAALAPAEVPAYDAGVALARRLAASRGAPCAVPGRSCAPASARPAVRTRPAASAGSAPLGDVVDAGRRPVPGAEIVGATERGAAGPGGEVVTCA